MRAPMSHEARDVYMIFSNECIWWTEHYTYLTTETVRQTRLLPAYCKWRPSHAHVSQI